LNDIIKGVSSAKSYPLRILALLRAKNKTIHESTRNELRTQDSTLRTQHSGLDKSIRSILFEKLADEAALIFIVDTGEKFGAELSNCLCAVKGHTFIHHPAAEVAGHAFGLKYGFDLGVEVDANFGIAHERRIGSSQTLRCDSGASVTPESRFRLAGWRMRCAAGRVPLTAPVVEHENQGDY
jgi:hypothetical protein